MPGPMSNYPNGFANGITVRGLPLNQTHPGMVFWVGNGSAAQPAGFRNGSNGNRGTFQDPFASILYALTQCVAGRGDIIMVKPGHAEAVTTAAEVALTVAGVAIVGLGSGSNRPTLTYGAAAANIPITAADMSIQNFLFKANFADVVSAFTATSTNTPTDFSIENCEFRDVASNKNFLAIVTGNATANSIDGFRFAGNRIWSLGTTALTTAIKPLEATARMQIIDNFGNWAVLNDTPAMLEGSTFNHLMFEFARNKLNKPNTSSTGGSFLGGSGTAWTGHAYDNYCWQLDNSAGIWAVSGTKLAFTQNYSPITGLAERSGSVNPAAT